MWRVGRNTSTAGVLLVAIACTVIFVLILIGLSTAAVGVFSYIALQKFAHSSGYSMSELASYGVAGLTRQPQQTNHRITFLLLGLDELATRGSAPVLSDTIMLLSLDTLSGKLSAVSLPRDLWIEDYQTKINSLYWYGRDRYPDRPETFTESVVSQITGVPIDHTIVVTLDQVSQLIDVVGGVEITVAESFSDPLFPRSDVDVTVERDPAKLYTTVTFEQGPQKLDGERALIYVRSRKSTGTEGTDDARTIRQQQIISALLTTLSDQKTLTNPRIAAQLLNFYRVNYSTQLSLSEVLAIARNIYPYRDQIKLDGQTLSIAPQDPKGVLTHPPTTRYNGQWVYTYRNITDFQHEIKTKLALPTTE